MRYLLAAAVASLCLQACTSDVGVELPPATTSELLVGTRAEALAAGEDHFVYVDGSNLYGCPSSGCTDVSTGESQRVTYSTSASAFGSGDSSPLAIFDGRVYWNGYRTSDSAIYSCPVGGCEEPRRPGPQRLTSFGGLMTHHDQNTRWTHATTSSEAESLVARATLPTTLTRRRPHGSSNRAQPRKTALRARH